MPRDNCRRIRDIAGIDLGEPRDGGSEGCKQFPKASKYDEKVISLMSEGLNSDEARAIVLAEAISNEKKDVEAQRFIAE